MYYFDNWSHHAYMYLVAHGSYGWLWILKHYTLEMKPFNTEADIPVYIVLTIVLYPMYWTFAYLAIANKDTMSGLYLAGCMTLYIFGLSIMLMSDVQTHFTLKYHSGQLITNGMNYFVRHPNYLGEIMLYLSFCFLSRSYISFVIFFIAWAVLLYSSMAKKEKSLSRYPEWQNYNKQAGFCWPKLSTLSSFISEEFFSSNSKRN